MYSFLYFECAELEIPTRHSNRDVLYVVRKKKNNPSKKIKNAWPKEFKETEEGNAIGTKRNKCSRKSRVIGRFKCTPHALGGEPENGAPK